MREALDYFEVAKQVDKLKKARNKRNPKTGFSNLLTDKKRKELEQQQENLLNVIKSVKEGKLSNPASPTAMLGTQKRQQYFEGV
jgi:hypothetical protein